MSPQDFFKRYAPYAMSTQNNKGVPASITLAQAALESSWGESAITKNANNFFGIKDAPDDEWHAENYVANTKEWNGSAYYSQPAPFRKYSSPQGSFNDHASFLQKNRRYKTLFSIPVTDYIKWAQGLKATGYATDPVYDSKLINLVTKYNLTQYDAEAKKKSKCS